MTLLENLINTFPVADGKLCSMARGAIKERKQSNTRLCGLKQLFEGKKAVEVVVVVFLPLENKPPKKALIVFRHAFEAFATEIEIIIDDFHGYLTETLLPHSEHMMAIIARRRTTLQKITGK